MARRPEADLAALAEIIEHQEIGIIAGRSLLEAAVRLAQERFETLLQGSQHGRVDVGLQAERTGDPVRGQHELMAGHAFQHVAA